MEEEPRIEAHSCNPSTTEPERGGWLGARVQAELSVFGALVQPQLQRQDPVSEKRTHWRKLGMTGDYNLNWFINLPYDAHGI